MVEVGLEWISVGVHLGGEEICITGGIMGARRNEEYTSCYEK